MTEIIIAFLTGILGPVVIILVKYYLDSRKSKPDPVREALITGNLISTKLDEIREEFQADRVWITQFHNGGNFYPTGKSMAKFSIVYETVTYGTFSLQSSLQNIPVNLFSKSLNYLLTHNVIEIPDHSIDTLDTYGLKSFSDGTGCKSGYFFAIKTIDDKFVGVLGVEFTKDLQELDSMQISELSNYASLIAGVLMRELTH